RPERSFGARRALGVLTLLLLLALVGSTGWIAQQLLLQHLGGWGWLAIALLAWPALAQRSLYDHVRPVARALAEGDLP
ncbi:cobalamin biosynthesis protein, partial [Klebsiella pneumoniae]